MENKEQQKIETAYAALLASNLAKANIESYLKFHGIVIGQKKIEDEAAAFNMKISEEAAAFNMKISEEAAAFNMKIVDDTHKEISNIVNQAADLAARKLKEFIETEKKD